jgi:hypothetical protein
MSDGPSLVRRHLDRVWERLRGEEAGLRGWTFRINRRCKARLGQCLYDRSTIEVSEWVLGNRELATDTLLHEVAHALVGPRARHGPGWQSEARRLGASPRGCASRAEVRALEPPPPAWILRCSGCEASYPRHRRDRRLAGRRCSCGRGRYAYHPNPRRRGA